MLNSRTIAMLGAVAAFAVPALTPSTASAQRYGGYYGEGLRGEHFRGYGYGPRFGYGYGYRGGFYGPRAYYAGPPVLYAVPPPIYVSPPRISYVVPLPRRVARHAPIHHAVAAAPCTCITAAPATPVTLPSLPPAAAAPAPAQSAPAPAKAAPEPKNQVYPPESFQPRPSGGD